MPLTEKELARFVWEEPDACEHRGLHICRELFAPGHHYQNLALGPYGMVQQASIVFDAAQNRYYVRVISLTVGVITTKLYQQAQRHASAIRAQILHQMREAKLQVPVVTLCVLIGRQVQLTGDLVFSLNLDANCYAFTCHYGAQGVRFENIGKQWYKTGSEQHPSLQQLDADILAERAEQLALQQEQAANLSATPAELAEGLVITPEGVVASSHWEDEEADE